jgi:hypothetical protein
MSVPNIIAGGDNPLSKGYSSRVAGEGGLFAELELNSVFSLRLGVEYAGQGGKRNGVQAMSSGQLMTDLVAKLGSTLPAESLALLASMSESMPAVFYTDVKNTAEFDYLMIPLSLQAGKTIGATPWRVYVNAGPFLSFLMSAKQISQGAGRLYLDREMTTSLGSVIPEQIQQMLPPEVTQVLSNEIEFGTSVITKQLRPLNAGVQGNLGVSYQHNRNRLFLEVGGNYGFVRVQKDKSNGSNNLGAATVMIGYAVGLM